MNPERFWAKVDKAGPVPGHAPHLRECWVWTAARCPRGYGRFDPRGAPSPLAHRISWVLSGRELVPGLTLDHLCRNTSCVRPDHLEQVSGVENTKRTPTEVLRAAHVTEECKRGHKWTEETERWDNRGERHCRLCDAHHTSLVAERRRARRIEVYGYDPGPLCRKRAQYRTLMEMEVSA